MYPYVLFLDLTLYDILIALGFLASLVTFRILADKWNFPAAVQNLVLGCALAALFGGYGAAVLTQALYNGLADGKFEVTADTGATFYGGLIGGAAVFLLIYFIAGHFLKEKRLPQRYFWRLSEIAAPCIAVGHALGRLGCLFAGCCHGKITDAWYGIYNVFLGAKTVPIQLFESLILFAIYAFLLIRVIKKQHFGLALYLMIYAVWRFFIEYFRADDRGATVFSFLTPSQLTAVFLFLLGIVLIVTERKFRQKGGSDET